MRLFIHPEKSICDRMILCSSCSINLPKKQNIKVISHLTYSGQWKIHDRDNHLSCKFFSALTFQTVVQQKNLHFNTSSSPFFACAETFVTVGAFYKINLFLLACKEWDFTYLIPLFTSFLFRIYLNDLSE